ncbi:MAG: hypothetical protein HZA08_07365 [Nitrospirae bacterium]|nr:hypothetical protein [Nitrospirota bacterium]
MRGAIAKRLRRQAYGDMSLKEERTYKFLHKPVYPRDFQQPWGTIINVGKRRDYLNLKKEYKKGGDENRK